MDSVDYNGKTYKVRTFHVEVTGHDHEAEYSIADEKLIDAMNEAVGIDDSDFEFDSREHKIDGQIYHYVESSVLDLPAKEICEKWLDIPIKLIDEITY